MSLPAHHLELLSPARDADIGREAVLHGADAVYIGGPSFGARNKAENTVADIAGLVEFAHRYGARIFATVNTILHDSELEVARKLIHQLYDAGVDALIVQDMGILELDIPPIALHASTQCDIRTVEKAKFLGEVGFSQLVLARELTIPQIREMRAAVNPDVPLEYFIHGALCVAFSGNCYISEAHTGRSANRGYAYLFYNKHTHLNPEARARLDTIAEQTELGAGMNIAMRDLEIRGTGDLLGLRQSGYIASVGFNLYTQMLAQAVHRLRVAEQVVDPKCRAETVCQSSLGGG